MYNRIVLVTKLPTTSIDLNTIYELQYNDFYRSAGTKWSYSLTLGWFENELDLSNTAQSISIDASGFNGNLDPTVDTVQELAQKVDDLALTQTVTLIPIVLLSSDWVANEQTVTITGVTAINELFYDPITINDLLNMGKSNVFLSNATITTLTFNCITTPIVDINLNITIK